MRWLQMLPPAYLGGREDLGLAPMQGERGWGEGRPPCDRSCTSASLLSSHVGCTESGSMHCAEGSYNARRRDTALDTALVIAQLLARAVQASTMPWRLCGASWR